ncbi:MAG: AP2/ERF family transcription factor [Sedimentisphaerales bacterium]
MVGIQVRIPEWLDRMCAWPVMVYRKWKYGYSYRRINLGEGIYAIVEQRDYYRVKKLNWCISGSGKWFYAVHYEKAGPGKVKKVYMHRFIMDSPAGKLIDHHNNKTLDNRRSNLRIASYSENNCNRPKKKNTTSQYTGVHLNKKTGKWVAQIRIDGKGTHLGTFDSEIEAARAYDRAAKREHGIFARLNFPENGVSPEELCGIKGNSRQGGETGGKT